MSNQGHVHGLLYVVCTGHGKAGIAAGHDVRMITENRERLCSKGSCRHVENGRNHFASNLMHVGDHQEQSLTSSECGGQSTSREGTMNGTSRTSLGLHFHDLHLLTPEVLTAGAGPRISKLSHRRGGGDRIDCGYFTEGICNMRGSSVSVNSNPFFVTHFDTP